MTHVWVVIENDGDYYNPERMIGVASSEEAGERLMEQRKAAFSIPRDCTYYSYRADLDALDPDLPVW